MFKNKEYVLAIYKEGSFTRASEKLYVSQPSLSATVKRLEEKIGSPLFDRSFSPIVLTDAGKEYVKRAMEIQSIENDFEKSVSGYANLSVGSIKIGGSSLFTAFALPKIISNFNQLYPKISFEIFEDNTKTLMQKLALGELDVVMDNAEIDDERIKGTVYDKERLLLAVPKIFTVGKKIEEQRLTFEQIVRGEYPKNKMVDLTFFKDMPFILLHSENDTGKRASRLFKKSGIVPKTSFVLDQQVTSYNVARSGLGVSFISDTLIKNMGDVSELNYFCLDDKIALRNVYFYTKNNHYQSVALRTFINNCQV